MRGGRSQRTPCWMLTASLVFGTLVAVPSVNGTRPQRAEAAWHHQAVVLNTGSSNGDPTISSDPHSAFCGTCHLRRAGNLLRHPALTLTSLALAKLWGAHCIDHE